MNEGVFNQVLHAAGDVQCNVRIMLLFPTCEGPLTVLPFFQLRLQRAVLAKADDQVQGGASCDDTFDCDDVINPTHVSM